MAECVTQEETASEPALLGRLRASHGEDVLITRGTKLGGFLLRYDLGNPVQDLARSKSFFSPERT